MASKKISDNSIALLLLIIILPLITIGYFLYEDYSFRKNEEIRRNEQIAQVLAHSMDSYLNNVKGTLLSATKLTAVQEKNRPRIERIFRSLMLADNHVSLYWYTDLEGNVLAKHPNNWPDKKDKPFVDEVSKGETYISEPRKGTMSGLELVTVSVQVKNAQEDVIGILGASVPISELEKKLQFKVGTTGYPIMVTNSGKFLVHPLKEQVMKKVKPDDHIFKHINQGGSGTLDTIAPFDGKRKLFSYIPLKEAPWTLLIVQPYADLQANSTSYLAYHLGLLLIVLVIIALATYYLILIRRREASIQKLQAEKLSLVSQLAAGMAHEIRNPLTSIKGFTQLAASRDGKLSEAHLEIILSEADRIESLIKETLLLAKPVPDKYTFVQLDQIVLEACQVMEPIALASNVQIEAKLAENIPPIKGEVNHLKQVFINLIKNALEAINHSKGLVSVSLYKEKNSMVISIQDNGVGISKEVLDQLGTPFLSTKSEGTGLGLMVCYRIIQNHEGTIQVKTTNNIGTIFEVRLPLE